MLADESHLNLRYAGEPVLFIGFPRSSPTQEIVNIEESPDVSLPILRQGVFAFPPSMGISLDNCLGRNYGLIDSFAQKGFSGSPVISLQRGYENGLLNSQDDFRPPRIVGIIGGHLRTRDEKSDGAHSGISYFVRSNSMIDALALALQV